MLAITSEERTGEGMKGMARPGVDQGVVVVILSVRGDSVFHVFDRAREGCPL